MGTVFQYDMERQLTYRCRRLNSAPIVQADRRYVLCWLQQTLRGQLNPVMDAAIALGNHLNLPVVVYHGLGQHYPHASDRLHRFLLEASYSLERDANARGLHFLRVVERKTRPVKGLVYRLAERAAAVVVDDLTAFVGRWQALRVAERVDIAVFGVDAARLVPENANHASDPRPAIYDLNTLVHGQTDDETWIAAKRQFLIDGWMHNNLRMYWGKRLIEWTPTPEIAWKTACYLNDRLSLDGRDPATYGNLRWCSGAGRPAAAVPVYGSVSRKSDRAMRARPGMTDWIRHVFLRRVSVISVPESIPVWNRPQASGRCDGSTSLKEP